ncbi:diguanylate cyclase [Thermoleophilia bacterium SCSIO 60948]|nr:diguanylate cyclase [Thermoleophilia bacterium SCSIO 60948]
MDRRGPSRRSTTVRAAAQLAVAIVVLAVAIFGASLAQRNAAERSLDEAETAEEILVAHLDMETGLRGYLQFGREGFLRPFLDGRGRFNEELATISVLASDSERLEASIDRQRRLSERWQTLASEAITQTREDGAGSATISGALRRKSIMDRFRAANAEMRDIVGERRAAAAAQATAISTGLVVVIGALFAAFGYLTLIRPAGRRAASAARERAYLRSQEDLSSALQVMRDEREVQDLVRRHLETNLPDTDIVVLNRNASENRLESVTPLPERSGRPGPLQDAKPESCLAVRLGQEVSASERNSLLSCELCGKAANSVCAPSLVGGRVIGSVLAVSDSELDEPARRRLRQSVEQSAPVLANLRTLAVAETRAATDGLTGLANKRSCIEALRRMVAQAGRTVTPLSAIIADIDHFKQVNDRFGHDVGDEALSAVAQTLEAGVRASDFVGRYGGEEFLILLPDTDPSVAAGVAEKLRLAITRLDIPALGPSLSASFGVAAIPDHASEGDTLVRHADRALYAAKRGGRNRVEIADRSKGDAGDAGDAEVSGTEPSAHTRNGST